MDDSNKRLLILYAEEIVRQRMSAFDVSHDYLHVFRVRRMAMKFAENLISRSYPVNPLIVELAALFHDLCDHKYVQGDEASVRDEISTSMKRYGMDDKTVNLVLKIVDNVSNSTENRLRENGQWSKWHDTCLELHW
ncbi:hypothetical protein TRICI_000235 [Trichomonascus ciferrii]|uniref:HD domain-containing protein n=1 Tax=Trichomonascus ciferrii TaxID=44093 RepID=A0A642VE29_9ASCO|nr:hypothetical protein TRICI_000235 [Trichomonascus ciferrii]